MRIFISLCLCIIGIQTAHAQSYDLGQNTSYCIGVLSADDEYKMQIIQSARKLIDSNRKLTKSLEAEIAQLSDMIDVEKNAPRRRAMIESRSAKQQEAQDTVTTIQTHKAWLEKIEFERTNAKPKYELYIKEIKRMIQNQDIAPSSSNQNINKGREAHKTCTDYINNFCNRDFAIATGGESRANSIREYQKCAEGGICKQVNDCLKNILSF